MPCLACGRSGGPVCEPCGRQLRRPPDLAVHGGVIGTARWAHSGPARVLVHRLKYQGLRAVAALAAADGPPRGADCLVPIPRVVVRAATYGIDPALEFAEALGAAWGLPVARLLRAPVWSPRRAGRRRRAAPPALRVLGRATPGAVVVDDVITSGATVARAASLLGARRAHAVTMVVGPKSPARMPTAHTMASRDSK